MKNICHILIPALSSLQIIVSKGQENDLTIIPEVVSSTGYYQVIEGKDHRQVQYFKECILESGFFKRAYINEAR